jgi:HSP20 family protein
MTNQRTWNPYAELEKLQGRMIWGMRLASNQANSPECGACDSEWTPAADIIEDEREYIIRLELAEVAKDDVKVVVENGLLTIRGERQRPSEEGGRKLLRTERRYGAFERRFSLPEDSDDNAVSADFKDGVLHVHLPKSEAAKPKEIEVNVS